MAPNLKVPPNAQRVINKQTRRILERLSQEGSEGATPAVVGIDATLLEQMVKQRLADRLSPLAPGASYRYRITEEGIMSLAPREGA